MSGTYKAIGINLKGMPLGEADRLLTVLTPEFGLIRVVAPGARKHRSSLRGRSEVFVINELLVARGKSLDKIVQAESLRSYPGLSRDLRKLTASQYIAELALHQALSDQPQEDLFALLCEHLDQVEQFPATAALPCLIQAAFHLLTLAGVAPQVQSCCVTQAAIAPDCLNPNWRVGFSTVAGGIVQLSELERLANSRPTAKARSGFPVQPSQAGDRSAPQPKSAELFFKLNAAELAILQRLDQPQLLQADGLLGEPQSAPLLEPSTQDWLSIERVLRHYAQYHFDRPIRSAALVDTCFLPISQPLPSA